MQYGQVREPPGHRRRKRSETQRAIALATAGSFRRGPAAVFGLAAGRPGRSPHWLALTLYLSYALLVTQLPRVQVLLAIRILVEFRSALSAWFPDLAILDGEFPAICAISSAR